MPFGLLLDLWECHKQYNGLDTTSQDVTDYVLSNNQLGKQLKFKVIAYEGGSGNFGPAESETVVFHKVTFMASGAAWKTGIAFENGTEKPLCTGRP